jgi:Cytochrome C oxidase, cbb3-type, subunit III
MKSALRSYRTFGIGVLIAVAVAVSGCGGSGSKSSTSTSSGAEVFASAGCGSCHTLSAAGAQGQVGPNLDALKPDAATVIRQVIFGGNGMPSFKKRLSRRQITEVAQFVSQESRSAPATAAFTPDETTIASCESKSTLGCFRQAFGNIAYRDGPTKALQLLERDDRTMPSVHADCHQITHAVGHASLAHYDGNAAEALAHGLMTCNSGYYHGVIELAFGGAPRPKVIQIARRLCTGAAITKQDFLLYQCVHGLGHGLMIYSGDDLPFSLHACDRLQTHFARISCTGGVFMQNLMPGMLTSPYLRKDDPLYPCNAVARRYKYYCYLEATSVILPHVGWDWHKAAAWCRRAERGWVTTCFQSYGRDASGASGYKPAGAIKLCRIAGNMAGECLYAVARDYANNYAGGKEAAVLCNKAPAQYRGRCFEGIGTILGALNRYGPQRRAACAAVTPRKYLRDCLRGAAVI